MTCGHTRGYFSYPLEVASIKPNTGRTSGPLINETGARFVATNATLKFLITYAYRVPTDQGLQVFGGPNWLDSDHFDIEGKVAGETASIPRDQIPVMVQSLLEDRFRLRLHREPRDFSVYVLTVAKEGTKLKLSEDQGAANIAPPVVPQRESGIQTPFGVIASSRQNAPPLPVRGMIRRTGDDITATGVRMSFLASFLAPQVGRPVLDKTGLEGLFDFKLHWIPPSLPGLPPSGDRPLGPEVNTPSPSDPSGASIFTAIQEIGLKLESSKAPVEVLVIDSVQKPTEN